MQNKIKSNSCKIFILVLFVIFLNIILSLNVSAVFSFHCQWQDSQHGYISISEQELNTIECSWGIEKNASGHNLEKITSLTLTSDCINGGTYNFPVSGSSTFETITGVIATQLDKGTKQCPITVVIESEALDPSAPPSNTRASSTLSTTLYSTVQSIDIIARTRRRPIEAVFAEVFNSSLLRLTVESSYPVQECRYVLAGNSQLRNDYFSGTTIHSFETAQNACESINPEPPYKSALCGSITNILTTNLDFSSVDLNRRERDINNPMFSYRVYCRAAAPFSKSGVSAGGQDVSDLFQIDTLPPNVTSRSLTFIDATSSNNKTGIIEISRSEIQLFFETNERAKCKYIYTNESKPPYSFDSFTSDYISSIFSRSHTATFSPLIAKNVYFHIACIDEYYNRDEEISQVQTFGYYTSASEPAYLHGVWHSDPIMFLFKNPAPPRNIIAYDTPRDNGGSITINWTASQDDGAGGDFVTRYEIYRVSSGSVFFNNLSNYNTSKKIKELTTNIINEKGITGEIGTYSTATNTYDSATQNAILVGIQYATNSQNYTFVDEYSEFTKYGPEDGIQYKYFILARYYAELETNVYQPKIMFNSTSIGFSNNVSSINNNEPAPATNLNFTLKMDDIHGSSLKLRWNMSDDDKFNILSKESGNNAEDVISYTVFRADGSRNISDNIFKKILSFEPGNSSYLINNAFYEFKDTNLNYSLTYCYIVMVTDDSGLSTNSSIACTQPNSRPYFDSNTFVLRPNNPEIKIATTSTDLRCEVDIIDKDGDDLRGKVTFTWKIFRLSTHEQVEFPFTGICTQPIAPGWFQFRNLSFYTTECYSILPSSHFSKGDKVWCEITGYDQEEETIIEILDFEPDPINETIIVNVTSQQEFIIDLIYINNTAPYASNVRVSPSNPLGSDNLECLYNFNDIDNDQEFPELAEFKWFINNEGLNEFVQLIGQNGRILPSRFIDQNDLVKCAVRVHDKDLSWLNNPLPAKTFVESPHVLVKDNSNPQIVNYYTAPYNIASGDVTLVGEDVVFYVEWLDVDEDEEAQMFVCDEFSASEGYTGDNFNTHIQFGDDEDNNKITSVFYTNQTGKYVNLISIKPYKIIRNNEVMYAIGTYPEDGDIDFGDSTNEIINNFSFSFPEYLSFYDANGDGIYTAGEPLVYESASGTPGVFIHGKDVIVRQGNHNIPNNANLINLSQNPRHIFFDFSGDGVYNPHKDFIYYNTSNGNGNENSSRYKRLEVVASDRSLIEMPYTMPIYDMYVYEVDNLDMNPEDGVLIAKDNNNVFRLGVYNHFNPQYNAQPLPDKYLAFVLCIDSNDDGVCDSDMNFKNNSVFVKASTLEFVNEKQDVVSNIVKNSQNEKLYNPQIKINYESTQPGGCLRKHFCSTELASINQISCRYTVQEADNDTISYKVRVCDKGGACSVERSGEFKINHIPFMNRVAIGSDSKSTTGAIGTDNNLMCMHDGATDENIPRNDFVLVADGNWTTFGDVQNRRDVSLYNGKELVNFTINESGCMNIGIEGIDHCVNLTYDKTVRKDGVNTNKTYFDPLTDSLIIDVSKTGTYVEGTDIIIYSPNSINNTLRDGDALEPVNNSRLSFHDTNRDGNWTWNTEYPEDIIYNVGDKHLINTTKFLADVTYTYAWYVKPLGFDDYFLAKNFSWYDNDNNDVLTHGNTMPGDKWICQVTPTDQYGYGIPKNSSAVTIGSAGVNPSLAPTIIKVVDDSNNTHPTPVGSYLDIRITYNDPDSFQVKAYICNSSSIIRNSGCFEREFARAIYSGAPNTNNEMVVRYKMQDNIGNDGVNYTVMLCDPDYHCSDVWTHYDNDLSKGRLNFSGNSPPEHVQLPKILPLGKNRIEYPLDFNRDINLYCNISYIDKDNENCNGITSTSCYDFDNSTFSWYRKRDETVKQITNELPGRLGGSILANSNTQNGDEIWCTATIVDEFGAKSTEATSNSIIIGSVVHNDSLGEMFKPYFVSVETNSNNQSPIVHGGSLLFTVDWRNFASDFSNIFICNDSNVTYTGCLGKTLASITTNETPVVIEYQFHENDLQYLAFNETTNTFNYTIMIANPYSSELSITGGFTAYNESNFTNAYMALNAVPRVSNVRREQHSSGYLYCNYTFEDKNNDTDGDDNFYSQNKSIITWYKKINETLWQDYDFEMYRNKVPNSLVYDGDVWKCQVQAYDGFHFGNILNSTDVPVGSTIPVFVKNENGNFYEFKFINKSGHLAINAENNPVTLNDNVSLHIYWNDPDSSQVIIYALSTPDFVSANVYSQITTSENPAILEFNTSDLIKWLNTSNQTGNNLNNGTLHLSNETFGNFTLAITDGRDITYFNFSNDVQKNISLYVNNKPNITSLEILSFTSKNNNKDYFNCSLNFEDNDNFEKYNITYTNYVWYIYDNGWEYLYSGKVNNSNSTDRIQHIPFDRLNNDNMLICSVQVCDNYSCTDFKNSTEKSIYDNNPNITKINFVFDWDDDTEPIFQTSSDTPITIREDDFYEDSTNLIIINWTDGDVYTKGESVKIFVCDSPEADHFECKGTTFCEINDYQHYQTATETIGMSYCLFENHKFYDYFKNISINETKNHITIYAHIFDSEKNYNTASETLWFNIEPKVLNVSVLNESNNYLILDNDHLYCIFNVSDYDSPDWQFNFSTNNKTYFKWFKLVDGEFQEQFGENHQPLNLDVVTRDLTQTLDQWKCQITPFDGIVNGTPKNSTPVTIGNAVPYENAPSFAKVNFTGQFNTSPANEGKDIVFNISWADAQIPNERVTLFVCDNKTDSSGISIYNNTGCYGETFIKTEMTDQNPIIASFKLTKELANKTTSNGTNFTYMICDSSGLCSKTENAIIFMNLKPALESINVTNGDYPNRTVIGINDRLYCNFTINHPEIFSTSTEQINFINATPEYADHSKNTTIKWFFSRNNGNTWQEHNNAGAQYVESFFTELDDLWKCQITYGDHYVISGTNESKPIRIMLNSYESKYPNISEIKVYSGNIFNGFPDEVTSDNGATIKYFDNTTNIGDNVRFIINWEDVDQGNPNNNFVNETVRLFMCNSSNQTKFTNNSGCIGQLYYRENINYNPIEVIYKIPESFKGTTQNISFYLCDSENLCSNMTNLSIKLNHKPNITTRVSIYTNINGQYEFDCRFNRLDNDTYLGRPNDYAKFEYKWFVNRGFGFLQEPGFYARTAVLDVNDNDKIHCDIEITDVYGLTSGFVKSNNVSISMIPILWNESMFYDLVINYDESESNNHATIIGYLPNYDGISNVTTYTINGIDPILSNTTNTNHSHAQESPLETTIVTDFANKNQNFIFVENTQFGDINAYFEKGNYIEFANHDKEFFLRYEIKDTAFNVAPNKFRINLNDILEEDIPISTEVSVFTRDRPEGWFNITATLYGNENEIHIMSNNSDNLGPAKLIKVELNKEAPFIINNTPLDVVEGKQLFSFNITDDHKINISSLMVNMTNANAYDNSTFSFTADTTRTDIIGKINNNNLWHRGNIINCTKITEPYTERNDSYICHIHLDVDKIINSTHRNVTLNITVNDYFGKNGTLDLLQIIPLDPVKPQRPIVFARPIQNSTNLTFGMLVNQTNVSNITYEVGNYVNHEWVPLQGSKHIFTYNKSNFSDVIKFLDYNYNMQLDDNEPIINSSTLYFTSSDAVVHRPGIALKDFSDNYYTNCTESLNYTCYIGEYNIANSITKRVNTLGHYKYFDANNNSRYDQGEPVYRTTDYDDYEIKNTSNIVINSNYPVLTMHLTALSLPLVDGQTYRIRAWYGNGSNESDYFTSNPVLYKKSFDSPIFYHPKPVQVFDVKDGMSDPPIPIDVTYDGYMAWNWTISEAMNPDQGEYILQYEYSLGYLQYPYDGWNEITHWSAFSHDDYIDERYLSIETILGQNYLTKLQTGITYYLAVRARSSFGLVSEVGYSNGIIFDDRTAPKITIKKVAYQTYETNMIINESFKTNHTEPEPGIPVLVRSNKPLQACGYSQFATPFDINYQLTTKCIINESDNLYATCYLRNKDNTELQQNINHTFYVSCLDMNENGNTASETRNHEIKLYYDYPENPEARDVRVLNISGGNDIYFNSTLNCSYHFFDNDGDAQNASEFRWYRNNSLFANTTEQIINLKDYPDLRIKPSDTINCSVRVQDDTGLWSNWTNSRNKTFGNYPPEIHSLELRYNGNVGEEVFTNSKFNLTIVGAKDPEGGNINFSFIIFNSTGDNKTSPLGTNLTHEIDVTNDSFVFTEDDKYNFTIKVCDDSMFKNNCTILNKNYTLYIDTTGPNITKNDPTPLNNSVNNSVNIVLNFSIIDAPFYSNPTITSVFATTNITNGTHTYTGFNLTDDGTGNYLYSDFKNISTGNYSLNITAFDKVGNKGFFVLYFHVNDTLPYFNITRPQDNNYYNLSNLNINFTVHNANYSNWTLYDESNDIVSYNAKEEQTTTETPHIYNKASGNIVLEGLNNGNYTLKIYANNTFGGSNSTNISFFIDNTPPQYTDVEKGEAFEETDYTININWTDEDSFVKESLLYYYVSTDEISSITEFLTKNYSNVSNKTDTAPFKYKILGGILTEGNHLYLYSVATDAAGNRNNTHLLNITIQESRSYFYNTNITNETGTFNYTGSLNYVGNLSAEKSTNNISISNFYHSLLFNTSLPFGVDNSNINNSIINQSIILVSKNISYSNISNSIINISNISNSTIVNGSKVINSILNDSTINSTVIKNNNIGNHSVIRLTAFNSTIINSSIEDSNFTFNVSALDSEMISKSVIDNSLINISNISNSTIVNGSKVTDSSLNDSTINLTVIKNNNIGNHSVIRLTAFNSTIINSTVTDCTFDGNVTVINSTAMNSRLENVELINAPHTVLRSNVTGSLIENSTIDNSQVFNSKVYNCTLNFSEKYGVSARITLNDSVVVGNSNATNDCTIKSGVITLDFNNSQSSYILNITENKIEPIISDIWDYTKFLNEITLINPNNITLSENMIYRGPSLTVVVNLSDKDESIKNSMQNHYFITFSMNNDDKDYKTIDWYSKDDAVYNFSVDDGSTYNIRINIRERLTNRNIDININSLIYKFEDKYLGTYCGDNVIQYGEDCDGENLGGQTCQGLGFKGGTLGCTSSCTFNTSQCTNQTDGSNNGGGGGSSRSTQSHIDHCYNGKFDPQYGETGVDCGGPCKPCETIRSPALGKVTQASCFNGIQDFNEEGVDCGGVCARPCPEPPKEPTVTPPQPQKEERIIVEKESLPIWLLWFLIIILILAVISIVISLLNNKKEKDIERELKREKEEFERERLRNNQEIISKLSEEEKLLKLQQEKIDSLSSNLESGHSIADMDNAGLYAKQYSETQGVISNSIIQLEKYIIANLDSGNKPSKILDLVIKVGWDKSVAEVVLHKIMLSEEKLEEIERYVSKQIDKGVDDETISQKLVKSNWSKEIADLIIADVHKITDNIEKISTYIDKKLAEDKSITEIHQILVSIGWNEHYIEKILRSYEK